LSWTRLLKAALLGLGIGATAILVASGLLWFAADSRTTPQKAAVVPHPIVFMLDAPDLHATTLAGEPWSLSAHRGKVVLIHFWATWCGPCLDQAVVLRRLEKQFGGREGFLIVNVGVADDPRKLRDVAERLGIPGEQVFFPGAAEALPEGYQVWGLPTTWLVSRSGRMGPAPLEKEGVADLIEGVLMAED